MPAENVMALKEEHKEIVHRLAVVEKCVNAPEFNERRVHESIAALGGQLREHFRREERTVYKPLNSRMKMISPTGELTEDHSSIWRAYNKLSEASLAQGTEMASSAQMKGRLSSLQRMLRKHLEKEEKAVFWLADCRL